jgi:glyoxylase-like metal-dependent hydrolase (beta-lactamase superfamily II)
LTGEGIKLEEIRFGPVVMVPGDNQGRYPFCHSLYIEGETRVLVDPASNRERLAELRDGPGVDQVWLTHYHEDHFTHLDLFSDTELWMSEPDAPAMEDMDKILYFYELDKSDNYDLWVNYLVEYFNYAPRKVEGRFDGGCDVDVDLGGVVVRVIPTPGHTAGNISLFFEDQGVLFVGDYDLSRFGPWYGDRYSSIEETIESVNRLREIPAKAWIPSHGADIFDSAPGKLWDDYLSVIDTREEKLLNLLAQPHTMQEIVDARIVYKKSLEPKLFFDFGERALMKKHLEKLVKEGTVAEEDGRFARI